MRIEVRSETDVSARVAEVWLIEASLAEDFAVEEFSFSFPEAERVGIAVSLLIWFSTDDRIEDAWLVSEAI